MENGPGKVAWLSGLNGRTQWGGGGYKEVRDIIGAVLKECVVQEGAEIHRHGMEMARAYWGSGVNHQRRTGSSKGVLMLQTQQALSKHVCGYTELN